MNIVEDWEVLEEYAGEKLGFYQLLKNDGKTEIRVQTGRAGFIGVFDRADDAELVKIKDFCRRHKYIQVFQKLRDEEFFR